MKMMIVKMLTALTTKSAFTAGANALHFICIFCSAAQEKKPTTNITKPSGGVLVNWVVIRFVFFGRTDIQSIAHLDGRTIDRTFRVSNS